MPAPDTPKGLTIQVFRVGEEMAALLRAMPNASEFIRRAVLAYAGCCCPLCRGTGVVPVAIAAHFEEEIVRVRADPPPEGGESWCPRVACELLRPAPASAPEVPSAGAGGEPG